MHAYYNIIICTNVKFNVINIISDFALIMEYVKHYFDTILDRVINLMASN